MYIERGESIHIRHSMSATIQRIGKMTFGWQKAFSFCTDVQQFRLLDAHLSKNVFDYEQYMKRVTRSLNSSQRAQVLGVPSMEQLFRANQERS